MAPNIFTIVRVLFLFLRLKLLELTSRFPPLPGGVLDEQLRLLQLAQQLMGGEPANSITPEQARLGFNMGIRSLKRIGGLYEQVASTRDLTFPGPAGPVPARLYLPGPCTDYPLFVLFHGGGFVTGDLESGDNMARFICRRADCAVLSVDYRLAPENRFPAAVEDCFAAAAWAQAHAAELSADPSRLLVGGDSAGGTLSAVVAQLNRRRRDPRLAGQVLFYPSTDSSRLDTPSFEEFGDRPLGLTRADVEWFREQYAPDPADHVDPRVSPLLAEDLAGLPPALVVTGEFDVLRDEGEAYARRLHEAGVPVRLMRCNGMIHGFLSLIGLIHRATNYFDEIVAEIRRMAIAQTAPVPEPPEPVFAGD